MSSALLHEISVKVERIVEMLKTTGHAGLLIRRNENLAWITAGRMTSRVLLPSDTNVAAVLITRAGNRYSVTTNNEAPRLADEDFFELGFEARVVAWHGSGFEDEVRRLVTGEVMSDATDDLTPMRTPLLPAERARYRALGVEVAEIVTSTLRQLKPGITEHQMNALAASSLWAAGIEPSVLLMAADERILKYKHAVAHGAVLKQFGMINLCARRHGLAISITRFVHFGQMPQQLADAFHVAADVNAALQAATVEGATASDLYAVARQGYKSAGFAGEEELHHQGGAAGYVERDWVATPAGKQVVQNAQGFAWNPSMRGGKVEDTTLLLDGKMELLTPTPGLPQVRTNTGGNEFISSGVLIA